MRVLFSTFPSWIRCPVPGWQLYQAPAHTFPHLLLLRPCAVICVSLVQPAGNSLASRLGGRWWTCGETKCSPSTCQATTSGLNMIASRWNCTILLLSAECQWPVRFLVASPPASLSKAWLGSGVAASARVWYRISSSTSQLHLGRQLVWQSWKQLRFAKLTITRVLLKC